MQTGNSAAHQIKPSALEQKLMTMMMMMMVLAVWKSEHEWGIFEPWMEESHSFGRRNLKTLDGGISDPWTSWTSWAS